MRKQKGLAPILIILLIALALGGFLIYQKQVKPVPIVQQTAQVSPTPSVAVIDETANWKTYINSKYNYSIKYPSDYSAVETSPDYVRFFQGSSDPNLPKTETYLSIQLDTGSGSKDPNMIYKTTTDGKTLRITEVMMDINEDQKPNIKAVFDQILSTFKFTN